MVALTVFTPTYNRAHTLPRTYESLCRQTCKDFEWLVIDDGSTDDTKALVESWQTKQNAKENNLKIRYIYKENGGLYTGYNTAYANIDSDLSICIDSDDYMPDDAVEKILNCWENCQELHGEICGIEGLDFDVGTRQPIGGFFSEEQNGKKIFQHQLNHFGDTKMVLKTALMKTVAPMVGFPGEKDFNPIYMIMQVLDEYPIILLNENLCWVEYQTGADSMSEGIFKQYLRSPRSFAKMRLMEMHLKHNSLKNKIRVCTHYVSSCFIAKDSCWLKNSTEKLLTCIVAPLGVLLSFYIRFKVKNFKR